MNVFDEIRQQIFEDMHRDQTLRAQHRMDELLEIRRREREDAIAVVGSSTCDQCGGVRFPNPNAGWQACQRCYPPVLIGENKRPYSVEEQRKRDARLNGDRTYASVERCPNCRSTERFTVGAHCVRCVAAAVERGEYDDDADMTPLPLRKPKPPKKRIRVYTPKPAPVPVAPKPVKPPKPPRVYVPHPIDRHAPKSPEWRAKIAAAALVREARRRAERAAVTAQ